MLLVSALSDSSACLPLFLCMQANSFFSSASAAAASAAAYAKNEAALARRVAQLPRPVMASRTDSSITITVDKRGAVSDDRMAVSALKACRHTQHNTAASQSAPPSQHEAAASALFGSVSPGERSGVGPDLQDSFTISRVVWPRRQEYAHSAKGNLLAQYSRVPRLTSTIIVRCD